MKKFADFFENSSKEILKLIKVFYPLFGLMPSGQVAPLYTKNTTFLLLGSFIVAIAIESSNLHTRLALTILKNIGTTPRRLLFGFMVSFIQKSQ